MSDQAMTSMPGSPVEEEDPHNRAHLAHRNEDKNVQA